MIGIMHSQNFVSESDHSSSPPTNLRYISLGAPVHHCDFLHLSMETEGGRVYLESRGVHKYVHRALWATGMLVRLREFPFATFVLWKRIVAKKALIMALNILLQLSSHCIDVHVARTGGRKILSGSQFLESAHLFLRLTD